MCVFGLGGCPVLPCVELPHIELFVSAQHHKARVLLRPRSGSVRREIQNYMQSDDSQITIWANLNKIITIFEDPLLRKCLYLSLPASVPPSAALLLILSLPPDNV